MSNRDENPDKSVTKRSSSAEKSEDRHVLDVSIRRRRLLQSGAGAAALAMLAGPLAGCNIGSSSSRSNGRASLPEPLPDLRFSEHTGILTEPYLQNPGQDRIKVTWLTEFEVDQADVRVGEDFGTRIKAESVKMTRLAEDSDSQVAGRSYEGVELREIWKHEAVIDGLAPNERVPYIAICSVNGNGYRSAEGTLQPLPTTGHPIKLLLTADQQTRPMSAANFQKVARTVGLVDGVLFAGDLVDFPNRASEWFDQVVPDRPPFFAAFQGTVRKWQPDHQFDGGEILQNAWLLSCLGNHEFSGRWRPEEVGLNAMYNDPQPRWFAEMRYKRMADQVNPTDDPGIRERWIRDNSWEDITYKELFDLPEGPEGRAYYAVRLGDVFVISMDVNRIWRTWNPNARGKFTEATDALNNPNEWGFGDFQFRPFAAGSNQHQWLQEVLASDEFGQAKYRIVIMHQTPFGLGDNAVPALAQTRMTIEYETEEGGRDTSGPFLFPLSEDVWNDEIEPLVEQERIRYIKYDYPVDQDLWRTDIEPLLIDGGVQLVLCGHSHLWNRTSVNGMHYLESSNVGNTFGAGFDGFEERAPWAARFPGEDGWIQATEDRTSLRWNPLDYPRTGDAHGRQPAFPSTSNPMNDYEGRGDLPFVSSNNVTVFSVFDSETGLVSSYAFDTRFPDGDPELFDQFSLSD